MHPSDIRIGQNELTFYELYEKIEHKQIVLEDIQCDYTSIIESLLLDMTYTPFYLDATTPDC